MTVSSHTAPDVQPLPWHRTQCAKRCRFARRKLSNQSRAPGLMTHPLELASCPSNDIGIDPFEGRTQLRLVEVAVVGDPAADARVVHRGQLSQGQVTAMVTISLRNFNPSHRRRKVTP